MLKLARLIFGFGGLWGAAFGADAPRLTGPWDMAKLSLPPALTMGTPRNGVSEVLFAGEPFRGSPTRVFAYYAAPATASAAAPVPGLVLLHDRGEGASSAWAAYWARRGYAALAVDLFGNGATGRLPDGGPRSNLSPLPDPQTHWIFAITNQPVPELWSYHAVAAAVRGISLLASLPEVDPARLAVHGVGIGGYLACLSAGIDSRLKAVAPVFGTAFVHLDSAWREEFRALPCEPRRLWVTQFDPSSYLAQATCAVGYATGVNDPDFTLATVQATADLTPATRRLAVLPGLLHQPLWRLPGTGNATEAFLDEVLLERAAAPVVEGVAVSGRQVRAHFRSPAPLRFAFLAYTLDTARWQDRVWNEVPAEIEGDEIVSEIPEAPTVTWFLYIVNQQATWASSPVAVYHLPESPAEVIIQGLRRRSESSWGITGLKPAGAPLAVEVSPDQCQWTEVGLEQSPGNAFEFPLPDELFGARSLTFRLRRLDM